MRRGEEGKRGEGGREGVAEKREGGGRGGGGGRGRKGNGEGKGEGKGKREIDGKRTVNIKTIIMLKSVNAPPSIGTVSFAAIVPNTTYIPIVSIINPEAIICAKEGTVSEPSSRAEIFRGKEGGVVHCRSWKRPGCISVNEAHILPSCRRRLVLFSHRAVLSQLWR